MIRRLLLLVLLVFPVQTRGAIELEPVVPAPTAGPVSDLATAYAGGRYLTVWRQVGMPNVAIWGAFSDSDGQPARPAFQIVAQSNAIRLRLFADGGSFLLLWNEANQSTVMAHVDGAGRVSIPVVVSSDANARPDAFVAGRIVAVTNDGATIFSSEGTTLGSGIAPQNVWSLQTAFAGENSFFLTGRWPDLTLSRYSLGGELLKSFTLMKDQCSTTTEPCWWIVGLKESSSGEILLLLRSQNELETVTVHADGTVSNPTPMPTSFIEIRSATLQQVGSQIWVVTVGGAQPGGPYDIEARQIDASVAPTILMSGIPADGMATFAGGPDGLFAAAVHGKHPSQVATALFREFQAEEPTVVSTTPTIQRTTEITSNGPTYLAAWSDEDGISFDVHWVSLNSNGEKTSQVFSGGGGLLDHSLVSDGFDYLMLLNGGQPLVARRVTTSGNTLGDTTLAEKYDDWHYGTAVVPTSAGYLVVWSSGQTVYSTVITSSGTAAAAREVVRIGNVPDGWVGLYDSAALAWNGTEVLLVMRRIEHTFSTMPTPEQTTIRLDAFRLGADGSLLSNDPLPLPSAGAPLLASDRQNFFIASYDDRFVLDRDGVTLHHQQRWTPVTDLMWSGTEYILARNDGIIEHVSRDGTTIRFESRGNVQGIDVASDALGRLLAVGVESSVAGPLRAYAYAPSDFGPLPNKRRAASH